MMNVVSAGVRIVQTANQSIALNTFCPYPALDHARPQSEQQPAPRRKVCAKC